jgi:Leucine-rich repeat (LRR) protein
MITKLENLPDTLTKLECSKNLITKIENLPNNLTSFNCMNNKITKLENLPDNINDLWCYDNKYLLITGKINYSVYNLLFINIISQFIKSNINSYKLY